MMDNVRCKCVIGGDNKALDLMKFIMAYAVVLLHCHAFIDNNELVDFFVTDVLTRIAVPFFFICSGWLLFRKMPVGEIDFSRIRKSLNRLFKMYFWWTIIYIPLICYEIINSSCDCKQIVKNIIIFLRNCVMVGSYYHFWFLLSLMFGILLTTWMVKKQWNYKRMFLFVGLLYSITLFAHSYYGVFLWLFPQDSFGFYIVHKLSKIFVTPRGFGMGPIFVLIGNWIAWHQHRWSLMKIKWFCLLFGIFYFIEAMLTYYMGVNPHNGQSYIMLVPLSLFVFMYVARVDIKLSKEGKVFRRLRQISMIVYCIHPLFLSIGMHCVKNKLVSISSFMMFVMVCIMSYLFSVIVWS